MLSKQKKYVNSFCMKYSYGKLFLWIKIYFPLEVSMHIWNIQFFVIFKNRQLKSNFLNSTHLIEVICAFNKFFNMQECNYS